ncbi:hypothetical protein CN311_04670 [Mesorhizobium sanjuanii]|uniref:Uncharacterized protein n=1 Tax=Mesorhizobium sanjuanii TaxID=2037900 RepID=A0A2A6FJR5_9HYPH|nr:hypothetical protein [Mesorhizobium sanjuanii]PDQ22207.1 hypothetical protein CN311_04670 [Mesorhizobium sanjuanii]
MVLILLLASPANSQLAPEASSVATANDSASVAVSDRTDIEKEPGKAQPGTLESEEALRRELAAARGELAKQAEALEAQQRRDEALAHSLETAHRVIENLKTTASLLDSTKGAVPEAQTSMEASQASVKQVLDDGRRKVEILQQELTTARQTIDALKTGANQEAAQASAKQALDDERRKVEVLQQELTTARQTIDALKTGANQETAQASAKQALEERRKVEVLQQELTTARHTIDALKTGANQEAAQASARQALERQEVEALKQELATARQTIDALQKSANLAAGEQANAVKDRQVAEAASKQAGERLALERERADSAERDLDIVRRDRDALKQNSMELSAALDQERERATGLARSLSAARKSIVKDKRRAAAERTLKAGTPASAIALSNSGAQPAHKPRSQKKQKVKYRKSPQLEVLAIELPAPLLPTRPLN